MPLIQTTAPILPHKGMRIAEPSFPLESTDGFMMFNTR